MNNSNTNRRDFLKKLAIGTTALPILATCIGGNTSPAFAQANPTNPLDENDPMAKTMGYVHDASKVDVVKWPKKAGPDGAKQNCKNCVLYLQGGLTATGQSGEYGKCGLFQNGLVSANGWCNSYAQKVA